MPPVVYFIFNRPDLTRRTFEVLRQVRPEVLFVVADAARLDRPGETQLVDEARAVTDQVDWDCDVRRLYAAENMGCGRRISSGITAALDEFESAVILEDDCLPDPTFFSFCDQLLARYRDDERVMSISGDNFQQGRQRTSASYYFSKYPHCWGWATWRRAWQHFDLHLAQWPELRDAGAIEAYCENERELAFWTQSFEQIYTRALDTWDLPWTLCCWLQHGLTILPSVNLVSNIGFRADATHTLRKSPFAELPTAPLSRIEHPTAIYRHAIADRFTDELVYSGHWQRGQGKSRRRRWFSRSARASRAA